METSTLAPKRGAASLANQSASREVKQPSSSDCSYIDTSNHRACQSHIHDSSSHLNSSTSIVHDGGHNEGFGRSESEIRRGAGSLGMHARDLKRMAE